MPKEIRSSSASISRKLPYPTANMPPYTVTNSSSTPYQATSPQPSRAERHSSGSWPKEKDELLMKVRQQGLNWQPIATNFFPEKSANACRKRHERLMEKRNNADDWDNTKMEALAKAYNDMREQMWRLLADRIGGEKWQIVEAKCMEKGLKTLQTAGRTAARRDRSTQDNALHPGGNISYFDEYIDINTLSPSRERSKSHPNSDDGFNDSALGPDGDRLEDLGHPSLRPSPKSRHHVPPSVHSYPTPSRGHSPTSAVNPTRKFSNTSSSAMSSTPFTPTITAAPPYPSPLPAFPSQLPSAREWERQNSTGSGQTLPSFSAAFGMPGISSVARMPLTSMS